MSWVGEATGLFGLLSNGWDWWRGRRDPARRSAQRLIRAFEAHGVARQQIIRLVPASITQSSPELGMADFSTPDQLKPKLSPALLDWAAGQLNLRRGWLDGRLDAQPHRMVDHYKQPARYGPWLQARQEIAPDADRLLLVWKAQGTPVGPDAAGPLCLVYEETTEGLDVLEWSRHWLLADHWSMGHPTCVENLAAVVHVARAAGVMAVGRELRPSELRRLQEGRVLAAELQESARGSWHPGDLIDPPPQHESLWRKDVWRGAQRWLAQPAPATNTQEDGAGPA